MKKLFKLSFAFLAGAVIFAACSSDKDDSENLPDQHEVVVTPCEVESTSAFINCVYTKDKSFEYQLSIENSYSEKYHDSRLLKVRNLSPDHEYIIKATVYNANKKAIGMSKTRFKTPKSSSPDDQVTAPQPITFEKTDMED